MRTASALPDCLSPWSVIWTPPVHLFSKLKCLSYSWFILQPEAWHPSATPLTLHGISPAELPQHCLWHFRGSFLQPAIMLNQRSLSGPGVQCSQCILLASFGFSSAVGWFLGPPSSQEVAYASWNFPAPIPVLRFPEAHGAGCLLLAFPAHQALEALVMKLTVGSDSMLISDCVVGSKVRWKKSSFCFGKSSLCFGNLRLS